MADEEVRPAPDEAKADGTVTGPAASPPEGPELHGAPEATPVWNDAPAGEPTMAGPGADRVAEHAAHAPPQAAAPRRSMAPVLLSVIGLVLIVLLGVNLYMMANPPGAGELPAMRSDLGGLKQRIGALEGRPSAASALGPVEERLKTLETGVAGLSTQLSETQQKLASAPAPEAGSLDAARNDLAGLDKRTADLGENLTDLKNAVAALPKPDLAPLEARIADLQAGLGGLKAEVAGLPRIDLGPLDAKVGDLQANVGGLKAAVAALPKIDLAPIERRLEALDARLKPIEGDLATARVYAAPRVLMAQGVLRALDDGSSFPAQVAALGALGTDESRLAPLRPFAAKGAPTRVGLIAGFADVRPAIVAATAPKVTGTVLDRMMASAQGIVRVRPAGASPGNDPDVIASRIADDLDRGALEAALKEWDALPEAGRAASETWAESLKARVSAEQAAHTIASDAIASLAPSP